MGNRWIITERKHVKHKTFAAAMREVHRLVEKTGKHFYVHRIKTDLTPSEAPQIIRRLQKAALACEAVLFDYDVALRKGYVPEATRLLRELRDDGLLANDRELTPGEAEWSATVDQAILHECEEGQQ